MKRFLLWSFERGSIHYDIICGILLVFIFLAPLSDRPDYMRLTGEAVRRSLDKNGNLVYTVQLRTGVFTSEEDNKKDAIRTLSSELHMPVSQQQTRMEPVYDFAGALRAYAIWMER